MITHNQPKFAKGRKQYLQMLTDGLVQWGMNHDMTDEQYEYEMDNNEIFRGDGFMLYKTTGCEFILSKGWGDDVEGFALQDIDNLRFIVDEYGEIQISYDKDCDWPSVLDYIEKAGFPIPFRLFKDYD